MRLTRVHVDAALGEGMIVELPSDASVHLARVLRARGGEDIVLFNGDGREFLGSITSVRGSRVHAAVGAAALVDRESPLALTLVQCVPRGDRMDFIVQKATELGVKRIVPVLSQRSVVRLDERQSAAKSAHWRAVAAGACEQCGRNRLPVIESPRPLLSYLGGPGTALQADAAPPPVRLLLDPDAGAGAAIAHPAGGADLAIGPEGGFGPDELEAFRLAGFTRISFGPRILRTETAAIAAVVWLQSLYGDLRRPV